MDGVVDRDGSILLHSTAGQEQKSLVHQCLHKSIQLRRKGNILKIADKILSYILGYLLL